MRFALVRNIEMKDCFESKEIFTVFTRTGEEEILKKLILTIIEDIESLDILIPYKILYRKAGKGKWSKRVLRLFDGYLFIRSGDPGQLFFRLKSVPKLSKIMHDGDFEFVPLEEKDRNFVDILCRAGIREIMYEGKAVNKLILPASRLTLIPASEIQAGDVIIRRNEPDKVIKIISGPLLELAPYVKKLDFHNRRASLDVNVFGEHHLTIGFKMPQDIEIQ